MKLNKLRFDQFIILQRGFDLPKTEMNTGSYPVIGSTSIIGYHDEYKVEPPGVVTGRSGSLGQLQYIEDPYWPHNTALWVKDFKGNIPRYVYYFLKTLDLRQFNSGAGVPTLNRNHLDTLEIIVHDSLTQQRVVSILSAYDDLIENNTRQIKILEDMSKLIYREWFVEFNAPGVKLRKATAEEKKVTGKDQFPEGWELKKYPEIISVNPKVKIPKEGVKPFVPMGALPTDSFLITEYEMRSGNSGSKFQNNDTLFARITPCLENGKTAFVQFLDTNESTAFGSTEFIVMRSQQLFPELVYLIARDNSFRENAIKSMSGATGRQRVQEECFNKFFFPLPDKATLGQCQSILAPMFTESFTLAKINQNLRHTRDLLLPKLVIGEIDV